MTELPGLNSACSEHSSGLVVRASFSSTAAPWLLLQGGLFGFVYPKHSGTCQFARYSAAVLQNSDGSLYSWVRTDSCNSKAYLHCLPGGDDYNIVQHYSDDTCNTETEEESNGIYLCGAISVNDEYVGYMALVLYQFGVPYDYTFNTLMEPYPNPLNPRQRAISETTLYDCVIPPPPEVCSCVVKYAFCVSFRCCGKTVL